MAADAPGLVLRGVGLRPDDDGACEVVVDALPAARIHASWREVLGGTYFLSVAAYTR